MASNMVIMTSEEVAAIKRANRKRELLGADVRNHNGARAKAHRRKDAYKRWGRKDKNMELRGE